MIGIFRKLDSYAKTLDDYRTKTLCGGLMLVWSEWSEWSSSVSLHPTILVDTRRKESLTISFEITLPHAPCFAFTVDAMDAAGNYQNNMQVQQTENGQSNKSNNKNEIKKMRIDSLGRVIGPEEPSNRAAPQQTSPDDPSFVCGNCYDASGINPMTGAAFCCQTCGDVQSLYVAKQISIPEDLSVFEQCVKEGWAAKMKERKSEGCRVIAKNLRVRKVAGNIHISPGTSFESRVSHVHDMRNLLMPSFKYDFSHVFDYFNFGPSHPIIKNPLDNFESSNNSESTHVYSYFIKVVATKFEHLNGESIETNQFAVTRHERTIEGSLPGIFVNYDISPMIVIYTETKKPFTTFLTGICAIVGGVYTVASIVDSLVYSAEKKLRDKLNLGKQG